MAHSSTSGKKVAMWLGKLELQAPTTDSGTSQGSPLSPVLYSVHTKSLADLNSICLSCVLSLADDVHIYETASDTHTAVTIIQKQLEKVSHWCQETESKISQSKVQALWCTHTQQNIDRTSNVSSLLQWGSRRTYELSEIPWDPFRQNANVQGTDWINKTQVQESTVHVESHGFKRHWTPSSVSAVSECEAQHHWLWSGSCNPVTVQPAEARQGAKRSHESFWEQQKTHRLWPCATCWTCHPWKQDIRWSKSKRISVWCRIQRIHSMMLSKKKRDVH